MSGVRIEMTGHGKGRVFVNGEEIRQVAGVAFESKAGGLNEVRISLIPSEVTITGPAHVIKEVTSLSNTTRQYLGHGGTQDEPRGDM